MYCINCGQRLPDNAKFCLKCGKRCAENINSAKLDAITQKEKVLFEATIGLINKDKIKITDLGIYYNGQYSPKDKITKIRWGGTNYKFQHGLTHSTNNICWGTETESYELSFGNRTQLFEECLDAMWSLLFVHIVKIIINDIKTKGEHIIKNTNTPITNEGIIVEKKVLFGKNKKYLFTWDDTTAAGIHGCLHLVKKSKEGRMSYPDVAYSYEGCDNAHVLEGLINLMQKFGFKTLDELELHL